MTSISEAKYLAISHGARERVLVQRFLNKLFPEQAIRRIEMLGNNKMSLTLTKDPESQNRTKHINVIHYYMRGLVEDEELGIKWISSSSMLANGLTKALSTGLFKRH